MRKRMRSSSGTSASRSAMPLLDRDRAAHRVDHARELDQGAVAHELDEAAAVLGEERLDQLPAQRLQPGERAGLVALHEPAVADHVGRHDGRQPRSTRVSAMAVLLLGRTDARRAGRTQSLSLPAVPLTQGMIPASDLLDDEHPDQRSRPTASGSRRTSRRNRCLPPTGLSARTTCPVEGAAESQLARKASTVSSQESEFDVKWKVLGEPQ